MAASADPTARLRRRERTARQHARAVDSRGNAGRSARDDGPDGSLRATALREADEEIGLRAAESTIAGRIDDIQTVSEYTVRPYVARIPDREYEPDGREVVETVVLPVEALTSPENYESERRDHPTYGRIRVHYFRVGEVVVWGATAEMLIDLLERTSGWRRPPEPDRHVAPDAEFPV